MTFIDGMVTEVCISDWICTRFDWIFPIYDWIKLSRVWSPILLSRILNQCGHCLFLCNVSHNYRKKRHSNISFSWIIKSTNMKYNIPQPWICLSSFQKSLQWFNTCKIDHKTNKRDESIMINWLFILVIKESNNI